MTRIVQDAYSQTGKPLPNVPTKQWVKNSNFASAGGGTISGNLAIAGNLSVTGTTALDGSTATTPATADNSTNVATTAFVKAQGYGSGTVTGVTAGSGLTGGAITTSGTIALSAPVSVANGGTGAATLATGQLVQGNGTAALSAVTNGQLPATATNDNAAAGKLGEYVSSNVPYASAVPLTTGTARNLTQISLTAGDWQVGGNAFVTSTTGQFLTSIYLQASTTSATLSGEQSQMALFITGAGVNGATLVALEGRFSLAATTTIYMVVQAGFSSGGATACGNIWARRVR